MGKAQYIRTPNGESLVLVPRVEYEALLRTLRRYETAEDREDRAMVRDVERRIAQGLERTYPSEVVHAVLDDIPPLRAWRQHYGWTAAALAEAAGISAGYLSQIETGKRAGSVRVLKAIAKVLKLDLGDLTGDAFG